ncbi:MAG: SPOR domain-containing protein [Candidatus Acidiferrales bacterium]
MAGNGKRGGERVFESRHLVGLFLGVVLLCCVFFTLGYVMGRTQNGGAFHAKASSGTPAGPAASATSSAGGKDDTVPAPSDWDFNTPKSSEKPPEPRAASAAKPQPDKPGKNEPAAKSVPAVSKPGAQFGPPAIPRGAIVLQVAALKSEGDALALADALQKKRYPAFVITPTTDSYYRVQVGPYADPQSATLAKTALERQGFKAIVKR